MIYKMNFKNLQNTFVKVLSENKYFALATVFLVLAFIVFVIATIYNYVFTERYGQEYIDDEEKLKELQKESIKDSAKDTIDNDDLSELSIYTSFDESCNVNAFE